MSQTESWQVSDAAAVVYEQKFVPALFGYWPTIVADAASIAPGDRVVDVACGTGILAREAAKRVGQTGLVTGLDINEGMLAVAGRVAPEISWRQGDAAALPFDDESFDVVCSQFALMYFPEREAALREMWRVLAPRGRLAVAVWASFERAKGYEMLTDMAARRTNETAAAILKAPFVLGDPEQLLEILHAADIKGIEHRILNGWVRFPSVEAFLNAEVKGSPLDDVLSEDEYQSLLEEAKSGLAVFRNGDGSLAMPIGAQIVTARKD